MNTRLQLPFVLICALAGVTGAFAGQSANRRSKEPSTPPVKAAANTAPADLLPAARVVRYGVRDIVRVRTQVRYTTLIVLPKDEVILDFVCGDKELWVINGEQNFAYVKAAKEGAETNLILVTASGNAYSFELKEVSGQAGVIPDLKLFLELADPAMAEAASGPHRFVSSQELERVRQEAKQAETETQRVKERSAADADDRVRRFLNNVRFAYRFEANKAPFFVRAIYHDEIRTYIEARPEETPTLFEVRDGERQPNLVNFTYENGVYVTDRILSNGYLVVGKKRMRFYREE